MSYMKVLGQSFDEIKGCLRNPYSIIGNRRAPYKIVLKHSNRGYLRSFDAAWVANKETAHNYAGPGAFGMIEFYICRDKGSANELRPGESMMCYLISSANDDLLLSPKDFK